VIPKGTKDALRLQERSEVVVSIRIDKDVAGRAGPEYKKESFTDYFTKTHSPKLNKPINIKKLIEEVGSRWHTSTHYFSIIYRGTIPKQQKRKN
jgi:hypothetical protein